MSGIRLSLWIPSRQSTTLVFVAYTSYGYISRNSNRTSVVMDWEKTSTLKGVAVVTSRKVMGGSKKGRP